MKPWYKKKRFLVPLGAFGFALIVSAAGNNLSSPSTQVKSTPVVQSAVQGAETTSQNSESTSSSNIQSEQAAPAGALTNASPSTQANQAEQTSQSSLSNNSYYQAISGDEVHSPAYSNSGVPSGATAQCGDGTYSFSENHRGTCSHHGGVTQWLN